MRSMRWGAVVLATMVTSVMPNGLEAQSRDRDSDARRQEQEARRAVRETQRAALDQQRAALAGMRPQLAEVRMRFDLARPPLAGAGMNLAVAAPYLAEARMWGARGAAAALDPGAFQTSAPEGWLQDDPGAKTYQAAREALNRRRYEEAASLFAELRADFPRSGYVADSYYWEAFALQREGGPRNLRQAQDLLRVQGRDHTEASTRADARALMVRIEAQLARRGDADAAEAIARQASGPCGAEQDTRLAALSALMNMNADQAVPILQEVLRSRGECSVELRRRAVFLIAQHMTDESVDILLDLAHRDPDPDREVREQAVFWLHQVDTPEALDALQSILMESDDEKIQERAIFAISQRSDERSAQILKDYAERTDVPLELRQNAIFWISQNPRSGGAQYLMDLYDRLQDDELKERAIFGVAQTSSPEARRWLLDRAQDRRETTDLRKNALFWAGQMGGLAAADLQGMYDSLDDREMKEQVIFVASQMNAREATDFLMDVATREEQKELRERAIFWLGQSNDPRVAEFLLTLIRGNGVAR